MKYTRKEVEAMYKRFIMAYCTNPIEIADYFLDRDTGGYVITKIIEKCPSYPCGSETRPFGLVRRKANEMYMSLLLAANVLDELNRSKINGDKT